MTDYLEQVIDFDNPDLPSAFDEASLWGSRFGVLLMDNLDLIDGISVLHIGCGTGFPMLELAHMHGRACRFTGVDIWGNALRRAAFKLKVYELPNVSMLQADGALLPLPDSEFDLIVSNLGINNFNHPQAVLSECARVEKPQACIILTANVTGHMQEFYDVYREVVTELDNPEYLERLQANETHRLNKDMISSLLQESGFDIANVIEDKFQMRYMNGSALLRHSLSRFGFLDGWRSVVDANVEKAVFTGLEEKLNALAQRHGELKMTVPMLYVEARRR